jgi:hypothetical protein
VKNLELEKYLSVPLILQFQFDAEEPLLPLGPT